MSLCSFANKNTLVQLMHTYRSALVPNEKQVTYKGKNVIVTQNVCVCNFNMMFIFVYVGWEDTTRPENEFPWSKEGK